MRTLKGNDFGNTFKNESEKRRGRAGDMVSLSHSTHFLSPQETHQGCAANLHWNLCHFTGKRKCRNRMGEKGKTREWKMQSLLEGCHYRRNASLPGSTGLTVWVYTN